MTPFADISAAPTTTCKRSPPIPNTATSAAIASRSGGRAIQIGSVTGPNTPDAVARNRGQQKFRDRRQHLQNLANNTSTQDLKHSAAAVWLVGTGVAAHVADCVVGKVNSADKLYLVIDSVRLDTKLAGIPVFPFLLKAREGRL